MANITFENAGTFEGATEWWISVDGKQVGEMTRERPMRWHANGVGGIVRDNDKPWQWSVHLDTAQAVTIPDGASVSKAKSIIRDALTTR